MKTIKKIIKENVSCDHIICQKDGNIKFKESYFYTHGRTTETVEIHIKKQIENLNLKCKTVEKSNHYNSWPKESWFEVIMQVYV